MELLIILTHNHPSTDPTPSADDIRSTMVLVEALKVVGLELLDHIVTNGKSFSSWKNGWAILPIETPQPEWEIISRNELSKIQGPEDLKKIVASLRQADPDHDHVIYGDSKLQIAAVERISTSLSIERLAHKIAYGSGREGSPQVWFESVRRSQKEILHLYSRLEKIEVKMLDASTPSISSYKACGLMESTEISNKRKTLDFSDPNTFKVLDEIIHSTGRSNSTSKDLDLEP